MKSLKRTLCLVLALVMVLGLFGIASATSFTDDNTIQYKEAVDVMTAIGAISGYNDGSFNPKGTITRAEAAKLVTYAVLGKTTADRLVGSTTSSFTDVTAAYSWAIPSIEYLVKEGVINGRGDGTFDPQGQITSTATLKMLLCALGYGKKGEYTGTGWDLQVVLDANKYGLTKGRTSTASIDTAATREEVALYCFNAIQADLVEYISTLDIYATKKSDLGNKLGTIKESVYGTGNGNLTVVAPPTGKDAFGSPANEWSYKGVDIGKYAAPATFTYTTAKASADLAKELKGYTVRTATPVKAEVNGKTDSITLTDANLVSKLAADVNPANYTGFGTTVKIYANEAKVIQNVVVIRELLAEVTGVDSATGNISLKAKSTLDFTTNSLNDVTKDNSAYSAIAGAKKGDYVVVIAVENEKGTYDVTSASIPTQTTGKITTVSNSTGTIVVNGTTTYAQAAATGKQLTAVDVTDKLDATLWLTAAGNVIYSKTDVKNPAFVWTLDVSQTLINNKIVEMADVVYSDGTTGTIPVKDVHDGNVTAGKAYNVYAVKDGVYVLDGAATVVPGDGTTNAVTLDSDKVKYDVLGTGDGTAAYFALKNTGTIAATAKQMDENAMDKGGTGKDKEYFNNYYADDVKFIYTSADGKTIKTVATGVQDCTTNTLTTGSVAVIEKNANGVYVITAVIIKGGTPNTPTDASKIAYIPKGAELRTTLMPDKDGKQVKVEVWPCYIDGAASEIAVVPTTPAVINVSSAGAFYDTGDNAAVPGTKHVSAHSASATKASVITGAATVAQTGQGSVLNVNPGSGDKNLTTAGAKIADTRSAAAKLAFRITPTVEGLIEAIDKAELNVTVLYDETTNNAKLVYITGAAVNRSVAAASMATVDKYALTPVAAATKADGQTYEIVVTVSAENAAGTLSLSAPGASKIEVKKDSGSNTTASSIGVEAIAKGGTDVVYTFTVTVGGANITANTVTFTPAG